jgi:hypothetical protein
VLLLEVESVCRNETEHATKDDDHGRGEGHYVEFRTGRQVMPFSKDVHIGPMSEQGSSGSVKLGEYIDKNTLSQYDSLWIWQYLNI